MKKLLLFIALGAIFSSCTILGAAIGSSVTTTDGEKLATFQYEEDLIRLGPPSSKETVVHDNQEVKIYFYDFGTSANTTTDLEIGTQYVQAINPPDQANAYFEFHILGNHILYSKSHGKSTETAAGQNNAMGGAGVGLLIDAVFLGLMLDGLMM